MSRLGGSSKQNIANMRRRILNASQNNRKMLRALPAGVVGATLILGTILLPARARTGNCHEQHEEPRPAPAATGSESLGTMNIPDTPLFDQDGREVRFYSDLVKDRVVAVNFIFTTCTTICPPMDANFSKLQKLMGERAGREFEMISVSVDPAIDTPPRLKAWGSKFGRRDGWTLLTGRKSEVDQLLKALKVFTPDKTDHSPILLLGDDARGEWTRAYGLAPAAQVAEMIDELLDGSGTGSGANCSRAARSVRRGGGGHGAGRRARDPSRRTLHPLSPDRLLRPRASDLLSAAGSRRSRPGVV